MAGAALNSTSQRKLASLMLAKPSARCGLTTTNTAISTCLRENAWRRKNNRYRRDRNFNRGRSTIRRGYGVIVGLASAARQVAACPPSRSCAVRPAVAARGRMPAGPIERRRGTVARAERPRVVAGRREARPQAGVGASADGREARDVPRLAGAASMGGSARRRGSRGSGGGRGSGRSPTPA